MNNCETYYLRDRNQCITIKNSSFTVNKSSTSFLQDLLFMYLCQSYMYCIQKQFLQYLYCWDRNDTLKIPYVMFFWRHPLYFHNLCLYLTQTRIPTGGFVLNDIFRAQLYKVTLIFCRAKKHVFQDAIQDTTYRQSSTNTGYCIFNIHYWILI